MTHLVHHAYGKTGVRLLRLDRSGTPHRILETTVEIKLEGDFAEAYDGDNSRVLPTDTQKNTVYALARQEPFETIEALGLLLARHFLESQPQVERVTVELSERPWQHLGKHPDTFVAAGEERRTALVEADREKTVLSAGIRDLLILKSSRSGFEGFPRDRYTMLKETADRLFATRLEATWRYRDPGVDAAKERRTIEAVMLEAFAVHDSKSVQQTLKAMGEAALAVSPPVEEIHLVMPNKHYLLVDLAPFGLDNPNCIFLPTDEPAGRIEGTLRRG
ncbi:MAG: urate oxidase [Thermoanaerobaculia bacterium]|nr:urate oxidase [Thermoanaerobaculia bacterium]